MTSVISVTWFLEFGFDSEGSSYWRWTSSQRPGKPTSEPWSLIAPMLICGTTWLSSILKWRTHQRPWRTSTTPWSSTHATSWRSSTLHFSCRSQVSEVCSDRVTSLTQIQSPARVQLVILMESVLCSPLNSCNLNTRKYHKEIPSYSPSGCSQVLKNCPLCSYEPYVHWGDSQVSVRQNFNDL